LYSIVGEFVVEAKDLDSEINKSVLLAIIKATLACRIVVHDTTAALYWLNQGATKVILHHATSFAEASLPKERVVVDLTDPKNAGESIGALKEFATEFLVHFTGDLSDHMDAIKQVHFYETETKKKKK
jgi:hypothetical protein